MSARPPAPLTHLSAHPHAPQCSFSLRCTSFPLCHPTAKATPSSCSPRVCAHTRVCVDGCAGKWHSRRYLAAFGSLPRQQTASYLLCTDGRPSTWGGAETCSVNRLSSFFFFFFCFCRREKPPPARLAAEIQIRPQKREKRRRTKALGAAQSGQATRRQNPVRHRGHCAAAQERGLTGAAPRGHGGEPADEGPRRAKKVGLE